MSATKQAVMDALARVKVPNGESLVDAGILSEIFVADGKVFFSLNVGVDEAKAFEPVRADAEACVKAIAGVKSAAVAITAERKAGAAPTPKPQSQSPAAPAGERPKPEVPGIKKIIAVASGKGGVGKSTTAVNLALALLGEGLKVGILDADVYGPSLPRLLGLKGKPETVDGKKMLAMEAYGLKAMSIGFLVEEETPMIWRGPMVISALTQMLREVVWGDLDVLVVDMPPGTGDAQLTMAQQVPLAGAVIVSTPQDLALIDARKGLAMFRRVSVPILGIVENMSYFIAPDTGKRYDIFGNGGAKAEATRVGVPFLGEVPLAMLIRENSDAGMPIVATEPNNPLSEAYRQIGKKVAAALVEDSGNQAPRIVFD